MIVAATDDLMMAFYGKPIGRTVRALVAVVDGVPLCVGGVYQDGERAIAFANVKPGMRERHALTGMKLAKRVMRELVEESGVTVFALADSGVDCSGKFLEHLGFEHVDKGVYAWRS